MHESTRRGGRRPPAGAPRIDDGPGAGIRASRTGSMSAESTGSIPRRVTEDAAAVRDQVVEISSFVAVPLAGMTLAQLRRGRPKIGRRSRRPPPLAADR